MSTSVHPRALHPAEFVGRPLGGALGISFRSAKRYATAVLLSVSVLGSTGLAAASEPAVKERNIRALARYDYTHINSDDVYEFTPPPTVLGEAQEEDIDAGTFLGFITLPIEHSFGARFFAGANTSKHHVDVAKATKSGGIQLGGDIFWRDPEIGEVGIGPRYFWTESSTGSSDKSTNTGGAEAYGILFLKDFGLGPVDLDIFARYLDGDVDISGFFLPQKKYGAGGQATVYVSDRVAVALGGSWSRSNYGGGDSLEVASADIDLDVLLPVPIPLTLGANLSLGNQESATVGTQNFGRSFFSLGFSLTISFTDAASLLELNRYYY